MDCFSGRGGLSPPAGRRRQAQPGGPQPGHELAARHARSTEPESLRPDLGRDVVVVPLEGTGRYPEAGRKTVELVEGPIADQVRPPSPPPAPESLVDEDHVRVFRCNGMNGRFYRSVGQTLGVASVTGCPDSYLSTLSIASA
jgi:hypothetical protein